MEDIDLRLDTLQDKAIEVLGIHAWALALLGLTSSPPSSAGAAAAAIKVSF